ncbi:MAG: response regulator [Phycisphaerales bacterium]|nr:MAG: response regulator [Phycisphaerales bacterium]
MAESFTDYLKLNSSERNRLLARLARDPARKLGKCKRKHRRYSYRTLDVAMSIVHPGGGQSRLLVTSRNLSAGGIAFLHGGYLHAGSECTLALMRRDGTPICLAGTVRHCRHLQGACHEVGVQFSHEIDPEVILLPEDLDDADGGPECGRSLRIPSLRGRVLIADENEPDRRLLSHQLSATGLEVTPIATAGATLDAVKKGKFDAVICGLDLYRAHGIHAVKSLREIGYRQPVLVLTAEIDNRALAAVTEAGATEVAGKPYDPYYLMYLLAEALNQPVPEGTVVSRFDGEPGIGDLLEDFVKEARDLAGRLAAALEETDLAGARDLCVRMAGSGANHGFDQLSMAARDALHNLDAAGSLDAAIGPLGRLISMCQRLDRHDSDPTPSPGLGS